MVLFFFKWRDEMQTLEVFLISLLRHNPGFAARPFVWPRGFSTNKAACSRRRTVTRGRREHRQRLKLTDGRVKAKSFVTRRIAKVTAEETFWEHLFEESVSFVVHTKDDFSLPSVLPHCPARLDPSILGLIRIHACTVTLPSGCYRPHNS